MTSPSTRCAAALAVLFAASLCHASQLDIEGVKLDDAINVRGNPLQLNGAGVRYKTVFKVYTAGLYLSTRVRTLEEALAVPGAKRVALTMLRDVDANELGKLFTRGVEDNSQRSEMSQLIPGLLRMGQVFSELKTLKAGDTIALDWVPGAGTVMTIKGKTYDEPIKEAVFFNALLRIWIGPNPADISLKNALLGRG